MQHHHKKKYLCFCLIGVILFCLLTRSKEIEGFENTNFPNSGIMVNSEGVITKLSDSSALTSDNWISGLGDTINIPEDGISLSSGGDYRYSETLDFSANLPVDKLTLLFSGDNNILGNSQINYLIIKDTVPGSDTTPNYYIFKVNLSCPEMSPCPSMTPCPVLSPVSPSPSPSPPPSTPLWEYVLIALFVLVPVVFVVGMGYKYGWIGVGDSGRKQKPREVSV